MRVLVVTNYFPPHHMGGAEVSVFHTCLGLRDRGVDVSVLVVNARMRDRRDLQQTDQGVPIHRITYQTPWFNHPFWQTFDPRVYSSVLQEVQRQQPDVVHVHNVSGATLAPFVACRRLGVPVVLTLHDHWLLCPNNMLYKGDGTVCDPAEKTLACGQCFRRYDYWADLPWRRRVFARLVRGVRLFVSPSQRLVDLHVAAGYDRGRFCVVPYGLYPGLARFPSDPLFREYAQGRGRYRTLLFAGAVVESKGVETMIEALPLLSRYIDRFRLLVAGWGDERYLSDLRRRDPSVVKVLGRVPFEEMRALYAIADLTLVPSIWYDNSPLVIYESLLAGTPVLGSEIGGIPELIQRERTGYVFPPGDALALTEKVIQHFSLSAPERRAMRRRCAEYAHAHLSMGQHLDRLYQVYRKVLDTSVVSL
jgi:glycosyltransferase involved in cell wall biosynthesis